MIRKILSTLFFIAATAVAAVAQAPGVWTVMPVYAGGAESIVESPDKVFYLSKGHLFSYDKNGDETMHYSTSNRLNDVQVHAIAYNPYRRYLAVAYTSHNIDLLYDDGRVVNIPDIRDASISADKTINSIDFSESGRMYVATNFGFVAFDDETHRVADSGIYNTPFVYAGETGGHIVLGKDKERELYASPLDVRHNSFSSFALLGTIEGTGARFHRLGDKLMLARNSVEGHACNYYVLAPRFETGTMDVTRIDNGRLLMDFTDGADGMVRFASGTGMRTVTAEGKWISEVIPDFFAGKTLTSSKGLSSIWASDVSGVGEYSTNGIEVTQLHAPSKPETLTCHWPAFMYCTPDGSRIYISNSGMDSSRRDPETSDFSFEVEQTTNIIESGDIRDVTCYDFDGKGNVMTGGTLYMAQDPDDSSVYFICNWQKGIYVLDTEDGSLIAHIDGTRLPFHESWAERTRHVSFDRFGNLWLGVRSYKHGSIFMLPAEKRRRPADIKPSDWIEPDVDSYTQGDGSVGLHHSRSNYVLYGSNHEAVGLLVYNHNGTPTVLSDDSRNVFARYVDQDGAENAVGNVLCLTEDRSGRIWLAQDKGLFVIPDITTAIRNNALYGRRPKVARNDGTEFADYLLDGEFVFDIAVDPSDRKWIATRNSGVYLVNADGTEVIANFNMENSPLPSNKVMSVKCDPLSNIVYFGTDKGVVKYAADAAPAAEDYNDVYAYPNPVRPDYTGWITVTGLMDNSLVKITDTAGNVVRQGTSEGGMFLWDGCNGANQRVRSGVYFVFASQNASGSASGKPVTKIMVIN